MLDIARCLMAQESTTIYVVCQTLRPISRHQTRARHGNQNHPWSKAYNSYELSQLLNKECTHDSIEIQKTKNLKNTPQPRVTNIDIEGAAQGSELPLLWVPLKCL